MSGSISKKLLLGVIFASSLITMIVTLTQIIREYDEQVERTYEKFDTLIHTGQKSLEAALWDLNDQQIAAIIEGFYSHPSIDYIEVKYISVDGGDTKSLGVLPKKSFSREYALSFEKQRVGSILLYADVYQIYTFLTDELLVIVVTNFLKTFLASFLILFVINQLLTRHLIKIARYLRKTDQERKREKLVLKRFNFLGGEKDELSTITQSLNQLLKSFYRQQDELEEEVARRTRIAEEALEAKSRFLANISHEIRTPMNGIMGYADILLHSIEDPSHQEDIRVIQSCGHNLLNIINDVLDFSKIDAGKLQVENKNFNLQDVLEDTFKIFSPELALKNLSFSYHLAEDLPKFICGDSTRIRQVLTNFMSNAIKFTERGNISVECYSEVLNQKNIKISIAVTDTGIGIPQHIVSSLFDPFSQADISTTRRFGGTGLGLSICQGLVDAMGGEITVQTQEGIGSTFSFFVIGSLSENEKESREKPCETLRHDLKILIAEDNVVNQKIIVSFLKSLGLFQFHLTSSGEEVLEVLKEKRFDMILMDCHMPGLDGYETTQMILKYIAKEIRPKIIAVTASVTQEDQERCRLCGMDDFLSKPLNKKDLVKIIHKHFP
ncbi:MAG: ATP-binding protein [Oligoflexales bacterium]